MKLWRWIRGAPGAQRVIPPSPATARLVAFSGAAMTYLAVLALALAIALTGLSQSWQLELSGSATLRITAGSEGLGEITEDALFVLQTTPGIADARVVSTFEQIALLEPWFGRGLPLEDLPLPNLIEITPTASGFDADALRLRLAGEVPQAELDTHAAWRAPLAAAEQRLRWITGVGLGLVTTTLASVVSLAVTATLASHAAAIDVLRQVGAKDTWIAHAFVRRLTLQATSGAIVGCAGGLATLFSLPADSLGTLPSLRPDGATLWATLAVLPPFVGGIAFDTSRRKALRLLKGRTQ